MAQTYFYHYVSAFVVASNPLILQAVRSNLYTLGCREIRYRGTVSDAEQEMERAAPDLLVMEDDGNGVVSDLFRRIRHGDLGANPFIALVGISGRPVPTAVKALVDAGADDVLPFPWPDTYMDQRMANLIHNRKPFVVTSDYVGPDRRRAPRPGEPVLVRPFVVPNPLKAKALDRMPPDVLDRAIQEASRAVTADKINRLAELVVRLVAELNALHIEGRQEPSLVALCLDKLAAATRAIINRSAGTDFAPLCTSCRTLHRSAKVMRAEVGRDTAPDLHLLEPQCRNFMRDFRISPKVYAAPLPGTIAQAVAPQP